MRGGWLPLVGLLVACGATVAAGAPSSPLSEDDRAAIALFDDLEVQSVAGRRYVALRDAAAPAGAERAEEARGFLLSESATSWVLLRDGVFEVRVPHEGLALVDLDLAAEAERCVSALAADPEAARKREFLPFGGHVSLPAPVRLAALARAVHAAGQSDLARALLDGARRAAEPRPDSGGATPLAPVLREGLEVPWMWNAVVAFRDRETPLTRLRGPFAGYRRVWPQGKYSEAAAEYVRVLDRMIEEERARPDPSPALDALSVEERARELVWRLREQNGGQFSQPGAPSIWADDREDDSPAGRLAAMGHDAVPALIDAMTDDALTRTVGFWRDFTFSHYVLRVGDAAKDVLERIAGRAFWSRRSTAGAMVKDGEQAGAQAAARAWWEQVRAKGEVGYLLETVASGAPESASLAPRLARKAPERAAAAILAGIAAARDAYTRFFLVQSLAHDVPGNEALPFFLEEAEKGRSRSTRLKAAWWLSSRGRPEAVEAMRQEWQRILDGVVDPEPSQGFEEPEEVVRFLVLHGTPEDVARLGEAWGTRSIDLRATVLRGIADLSSGRGDGPPGLPADREAALREVLGAALDDEEEGGPSYSWSGGSIDDCRLCDVAAQALLERTTGRRVGLDEFYGKAREERDDRIEEVRAAWRASTGRPALPRAGPPEPRRRTPEDLAPVVAAVRGARNEEGRRQAAAAIVAWGPGVLPALPALVGGLPSEDPARPALARAAADASLVVTEVLVDADEGTIPPDVRAGLLGMNGAPLTADALTRAWDALVAGDTGRLARLEIRATRPLRERGVRVAVRARRRTEPAPSETAPWDVLRRVRHGREVVFQVYIQARETLAPDASEPDRLRFRDAVDEDLRTRDPSAPAEVSLRARRR